MSTQPHPAPTPPAADAALDITFETDALTTLVQLFARHGDAYRAHSPALGRDLWVLSHPDHVRHVLVDHHADFTKGVGIERVAILLGNGIMTSEGDDWRRQRKLIQPTFHRKVVATWMPHIHAATASLAAKWDRAADAGEPINVTQDMSEATLDVVLRALFGDGLARFEQAAGRNPFALLTDHTERNLAFAYRFRQLGKLIMEDVERRRRDGIHRQDIVSQLIEARDRQTGEPMSDRQLLDEILTLIVAGHETTASSLNWFWYLLARAPTVAARIHAEVDAASDAPPGYDDLARFPYVRRTLDETLRLYPPGWLLTRRSLADSRVGDYALPAGTDVLVSPYLVQRHPRYWPDPEAFDPERFLPAACAARNRFVYLPFGLGPRACIGEHFALIEMHAHVAILARRFALALLPGQTVEIEPQVNLRTRQPVQMRVQRRRHAR
ncbi:MAG: cytochrome P450 [Burkholderiales bacterium]